ncbi:MAG TPA: DUF3310 domain-containing protein [Candidatus Hodarchaeales archaeon]|nr:DUF3310 domain-containing protein [Candidatus Hodarchaeales archaeon]
MSDIGVICSWCGSSEGNGLSHYCPKRDAELASTYREIKKEAVNNPDHYGGKDNPYEVIKVLKAWLTYDEYVGFLKGNIIKYNARAKKKNGTEDYAKAAWYQRELEAYTKEYVR